MQFLLKLFLSTFFIGINFILLAQQQSITGFVLDENSDPLIGVSVYLKHTTRGVTTDVEGKYYMMLPEGIHDIVLSYVGYKTKTFSVQIKDKDIIKNLWMEVDSEMLNEIEVVNKKKDLSYQIIKSAIKNRQKNRNTFTSAKYNYYLKAVEVNEFTEKYQAKKNARSLRDSLERLEKEVVMEDTLKNDSIKKRPAVFNFPKLKMIEIVAERNFQAPENYKDFVKAKKKVGSTWTLFVPNTKEAKFDFYRNLIFAPQISPVPIISPLSPTSIANYKFKLKDSYLKDGELIYIVKVIPKKLGNTLFEGELHIRDKVYNIVKVDLKMNNGNLVEFDDFRIIQEYENSTDSIWLMSREEFVYQSKSKKTIYKGKTIIQYYDHQFNLEFPKRFFNNELIKTEEDAYKKDSSFWSLSRPEKLSMEEEQAQHVYDSIQDYLNSDEYLDSIAIADSKITALRLLWHGQSRINREKQRTIYLGSVANMIEPIAIGGLRIGYRMSVDKTTEEKRLVRLGGKASYGLLNSDWRYNLFGYCLINPKKFTSLFLNVGKYIGSINFNESFLGTIKRSNYIYNNRFNGHLRHEFFNGFYASFYGTYGRRSPINDLKFVPWSDNFLQKILGDKYGKSFENNAPIDFEPYTNLKMRLNVSYQFKQEYITEPKRKIILGSQKPKIGVLWEKGIKGVLGAINDFDYIEFYVDQNFNIGTLGNFKYNFNTGKFLQTRKLDFIDYNFHRGGDPFIYTNPLDYHQLLKQTFSTIDWHYQFLFTHHFNGALMSKVPFIKRSKINLMVGGGALYTIENNYRHNEFFGGAERVFKVGRERIRLGIYYAIAESNKHRFDNGFKFSIEFYNHQEKKWNF